MAVTIKSSFTIKADPPTVWRALTDIELSAPCFPGAELQEKLADGSHKAVFSVKLGPLLLKFAGKFKISEQNETERTASVAASGTDTKGRGGADAVIQVHVQGESEQSHVDVVSNVNLSGTVAQYGRGASMIEALSRQLLDQFAKNLTTLLESPVDEACDIPSSAAGAVPLNAGALARNALWQSIRGKKN